MDFVFDEAVRERMFTDCRMRVLYDILNRLFSHGSVQRTGRHGYRMVDIFLACTGIAAAGCLLESAWEYGRFIAVEYGILSKRVRKPCKFVLLSDLHNKIYGKDNGKLIAKIDSVSPDAVLVAGDMLTAAKGQSYDAALSLLGRLAGRYPVYYGMGNHECRLQSCPDQYGAVYENYAAGLKEKGIVPLINENVYLPQYNVAVCGSKIDERYFKKFRKYPMDAGYLPKILGKPRREACQILIAHNPQYFEEYAAWGADIVVSGHVHGGIMKLPVLGGVLSPNMTLFPKYDGGRFEYGGSTMILSRGLGTHTIPVRVFNPGELVVIALKPG